MLIPPQLESLDQFIDHGPYVGYCYSYPHKTAYRTLEPTRLNDIWKVEDKSSLFLYVHIPFCEMRCGFCNLFTFSQPNSEIPNEYLSALERQAKIIGEELDEFSIRQLAIGGGTPTFLNESELSKLIEILQGPLRVKGNQIPVSVEASPATVTPAKLKLLRGFGVDRLSMGIQTFDAKDAGKIGRPQKLSEVYQAIEWSREASFPILNLDLIYGGADQTPQSWDLSVKECLSFRPEEVYLYPLYVRPLTGLANRQSDGKSAEEDARLGLYRIARDRLLSSGYQQTSMRMFRLPTSGTKETAESTAESTAYRCQEDGMIGLGVGARSYTRSLHYSSRYAVDQKSIGQIIDAFISQSDDAFRIADYGIELSVLEQRRRFLIISILLTQGLSRNQFRDFFDVDVLDEFPQIHELEEASLATISDDQIRLNEKGIELSDAIGPWLYSPIIRKRMEEYSWAVT